MRDKDVEKWTFDELATWVTGYLFDALIKGGTGEMRSSWWVVYTVVCKWQDSLNPKADNFGALTQEQKAMWKQKDEK